MQTDKFQTTITIGRNDGQTCTFEAMVSYARDGSVIVEPLQSTDFRVTDTDGNETIYQGNFADIPEQYRMWHRLETEVGHGN